MGVNSKKPGSARSGRRDRARLVLAAVLGALAAACSVGLLAHRAWLISRSAQRPPVLYLMAPAAVVQAFGLGRAGLRYAERLAGHDAALRLLADAGCAPTTPWPGLPRRAWPATGPVTCLPGSSPTSTPSPTAGCASGYRTPPPRWPALGRSPSSESCHLPPGSCSPRRSSSRRSPRPPSRSRCPAARNGTWCRCAASWPPPPWNCLTGRRNSPPSARTGAPSPPSRARGRG